MSARVLFLICIILSLAAAVAGLHDFGLIPGVIAPAVFCVLFWFFRKPAAGLFLLLAAGAAAAGIIAGAEPLFMILFSGLSLACRDLAELENVRNEYSESKGLDLYTSIRIKTLAAAVGGGTAAAILFHFIRLRISFTLMFFISVGAFYFLLRVFSLFSRK